MCSCGQVNLYSTKKAFGDVLLAAGILFSDSCPTKTLRMLKQIGIATIALATFYEIQDGYLWPATQSVWLQEQDSLLKACTELLTIAGDGRANSPGHCAKYGTYTFLEVHQEKIIHIEVVQQRSQWQPCHGKRTAHRGLTFLKEERGSTVGTLLLTGTLR